MQVPLTPSRPSRNLDPLQAVTHKFAARIRADSRASARSNGISRSSVSPVCTVASSNAAISDWVSARGATFRLSRDNRVPQGRDFTAVRESAYELYALPRRSLLMVAWYR